MAHRGPEARTYKQMAEQAVAHTGNAGFGQESWESVRTLGLDLGGSTGSMPKGLEGKLGNTGIRVQPQSSDWNIHPV